MQARPKTGSKLLQRDEFSRDLDLTEKMEAINCRRFLLKRALSFTFERKQHRQIPGEQKDAQCLLQATKANKTNQNQRIPGGWLRILCCFNFSVKAKSPRIPHMPYVPVDTVEEEGYSKGGRCGIVIGI
jgi:hypothetical protein